MSLVVQCIVVMQCNTQPPQRHLAPSHSLVSLLLSAFLLIVSFSLSEDELPVVGPPAPVFSDDLSSWKLCILEE